MGGKLPEGMLSISTSRATPVCSGHSQTQPRVADDDSHGQQTTEQPESIEDTVRERIMDKWNNLKMFCCSRHDSLKLEHPETGDATTANEIFTVSRQVPPPRTQQLNVHRTLSRDKESNLSQPKPRVLVGEADSEVRSGRENDTGTPQIVFGRERLQVLDLIRQRTAQLCVFLKQKFHTRTLNIENSSDQDSAVDVEPHLQTITSTHTSVTNTSSLTVDPDSSAFNLNVPRRQKKRSESTESDTDNSVQNLVYQVPSVLRVDLRLTVDNKRSHGGHKENSVQNLAPDSKPPVGIRLTCEDELQSATRRVDSVPPQLNTTTAIIHKEQSPWLNVRDSSGNDVMNVKNVLQRAKSVNFNTGKPMKTGIQVSDDTNVRYRPNWTRIVKETSAETELDAVTNEDDIGRLTSSSAAAAAAATDEQNEVFAYTGTENNGSPPSDGQSDYQHPTSVTSDQWSSYDPCLRRNDRDRDEMSHDHADDES